jgi:uncharacterized radical SAM protein YgiQ
MYNNRFIPITKKEVDDLGWKELDVILITGDAYVDHPAFGVAVIARILEREELKVAIIPQPNWKDDLRDFKKFGKPKLFFGITAGNMDSMVNHYTAFKRLRSDDAYTPGNQSGFRPDYATVVYSNIIKDLYPETPIIIGGVEASMRRLSHYDYWSDQFKPSILMESQADLLVYGMGEKPIVEIANAFKKANSLEKCKSIPQVAFLTKQLAPYIVSKNDVIELHSFEKELNSKKNYGENFVLFEKESNKRVQKKLVQAYKDQFLIVNPPYLPFTEAESDHFALYDCMLNAPHPKYKKRGEIPAFEMIKNSITIHRGCFGGCSFCAIAAHQGKFISSRSESSILDEIKNLSQRDYFKGHISDLGGPSANMYKMGSINSQICNFCSKPSCIFPQICKNLDFNHEKLINLYKKARNVAGIKQITIGSGIRYDMLVSKDKSLITKNHLQEYINSVIQYHVSGRLKVAPEHTSSRVLQLMRKPNFSNFMAFYQNFNETNKKFKLKQQLIPYFISSHPGCSLIDMSELAIQIKNSRKITAQNSYLFGLETDHVQDFTPTPMTYATAIYYLGFDPYTGNKIEVAKSVEDKKNQNLFFFYHKKENMEKIKSLLQKKGRKDLYNQLFGS